MKRMISLLIVLCFTANAFASTAGVTKLNRAIDEYQFNLTVVWDQKDQTYPRAEAKKFLSSVKALVSEESLSATDLRQALGTRLKSAEQINELELQLRLAGVDDEISLIKFIDENSSQLYQRGASWNGGVGATVAAGALGFLFLGVIGVIFLLSPNCKEWKDEYYCKDLQDCDGTGEYRTCSYDGQECGVFPKCQSR
jgi:hypothetical protein